MPTPIIFLVGPTGSGKSEIALRVAQRVSALILNCDSVQCYRRLDIGSAKPSKEEQDRVRHLLLDWVDYPERLTVGGFRERALQEIRDQDPHSRILGVGGSGFYLQSLWCGMPDFPEPKPDRTKSTQEDLKILGEQRLHDELKHRDPVAAARIHPHDHYRLVRALSVVRSTGQPLPWGTTARFGQGLDRPLRVLGLRVSRETLRARVELRTKSMLSAGLIDEVKELNAQGFGGWWPLQSVGYAEVQKFLAGEMNRDELYEEIVAATMRLAKKQMTWFRQWSEIEWWDLGERQSQLASVEDRLLDLWTGST